MESTSSSARRGEMPWRMLLLTASLLTFWSPPTTAQITVVTEPRNAIEGKEVLLLVQNLPEEKFRRLTWYKNEVRDDNSTVILDAKSGNVIQGCAYSGRETLYRNGSLLIQNLTMMDSVKYHIVIKMKTEDVFRTIKVQVYPPKCSPYVNASNWHPLEQESAVVLTCESKSPNMTYRWFINSQPVQPSTWLQLSPDNKTLTVFHITRKDSGPYVCETSNICRSEPVTLNISNASSNFPQKSEIFSLSCLTDSYPTTHFSLFVGKKQLGSTQTRSNFNLPLKDRGSYSCLVNNQTTELNKPLEIHITVSEPVAQPYIQFSKTDCEDPVVLTCLTSDTGVSTRWYFNDMDLQPEERRKLSADNRTLTLEPFLEADQGDYQCEAYNGFRSQKRSPVVRLQVISCLRKPKNQMKRRHLIQKNYGKSKQSFTQKNYEKSNKQLPDMPGLKDCCITQDQMSSHSSYPLQVPNRKQ